MRTLLTPVAQGLFTIICLLSLASHSVAQEAGQVLTIEDAIALALDNNRSLRNASLEVEKIAEQVFSAKTRRLPSFNMSVNSSLLFTRINFLFPKGAFGTYPTVGPIPGEDTEVGTPRRISTYATAEIAQPLTHLYRLNLNVSLIDTNRETALEVLKGERLAIANTVKRRYYALLRTLSEIDAKRQSLKSYQELSRVVEDRLKKGAALSSEFMEVKAQSSKVEYEILAMENGMGTLKEELNQLMGRAIQTDFTVKTLPVPEPASQELEEARNLALLRRPEVKEATLKIRQAELDKKIKQSEYIPDVHLAVNYISMFDAKPLPANVISGGVVLTWEPFDWGRKKHEVAEKSKALAQAANSLEETKEKILAEVNAAYRKMKEATLLVETTRQAMEAAQEKSRVEMNKYKKESALLKDVLNAHAQEAEACSAHQKSLLEVHGARADFDKAIGEE